MPEGTGKTGLKVDEYDEVVDAIVLAIAESEMAPSRDSQTLQQARRSDATYIINGLLAKGYVIRPKRQKTAETG